MATVKLEINRANLSAKIQILRSIVSQMTNNPHFPSPAPALADVTTAINALETAANEASAARAEAKRKTALQNSAETTLDSLAAALAGYVDAASEGDAEIILSSGMGVRSKPSKPQPMTAPEMAGSELTQVAGELLLRWSRVAGAYTYLIERTTDPAAVAGWTNGDSATRTKAVVKGLTPGTRYSFRVAAVGPLGTGPWSEPVTRTL